MNVIAGSRFLKVLHQLPSYPHQAAFLNFLVELSNTFATDIYLSTRDQIPNMVVALFADCTTQQASVWTTKHRHTPRTIFDLSVFRIIGGRHLEEFVHLPFFN